MRNRSVLVLGGSGFVGRHLIAQLAARGARVTVPTRRYERAKHLLLLPTVEVIECDVGDARTLARLARGKDALINLVGVLHSRPGRERGPNDYGPDFAAAHVELALAAVSACREAGVGRLLHVSAIGAATEAPSEYLRSKGYGERAVLAADDLAVTVFRPSVIFGPEDRFLNLFAQLARWFPVLPLACPDARFQPVYVGDVAAALVAALEAPEAAGKVFELGGPRRYRLRELVEYVCRLTGRRRLVIGLPDWAAWLQARALELAMPVPLLTRDNLRSMQVPSVTDQPLPFGLRATPLEAAAPAWLAPSGVRERYGELRLRARR
ncbi:MAG: complex I NDUFA9 subunit family protein [Burkholderiales bacterium]|nr:complex I NDUFA9 subunit family protein [Burkholderiales bacterium]